MEHLAARVEPTNDNAASSRSAITAARINCGGRLIVYSEKSVMEQCRARIETLCLILGRSGAAVDG